MSGTLYGMAHAVVTGLLLVLALGVAFYGLRLVSRAVGRWLIARAKPDSVFLRPNSDGTPRSPGVVGCGAMILWGAIAVVVILLLGVLGGLAQVVWGWVS